ncbi:RNA polymerase Rpc34 subunit-domain-containing protein [Pisolithus orientalis]|uniref:RNA polymerase Rpc34 subunit-domain-containing protein n=1 Tax=Pisolithus orientalis TaxID=936130 RepID=UPI0022258F97|nr:RNA polymerase Rpc34 subunit-domain-containing protein [Pisolithus orientalis]KAI6003441.1 RNA polymerase Rpc34 subunit-domain-containing protein [Pisolithus orientalis]
MSGRKLSADELKLHQAALAAHDKILAVKDADKVVPDAAACMAAINFLLGTGMFKVMASAGIWTKHLKAKTELHQTVIDRCLKSLVQKQLHPMHKIYMLAHLEPLVELMGGPWYTDNELDAEFIKLLSSACLHYICDCIGKHVSPNQICLYVIGAASSYPSAQQIQHFLSKSKITETELGVEHVEMLLRVLELNGEIEKIPAFSAGAWNPLSDSEGSGSGLESELSEDNCSCSKKHKCGSSKTKESSKCKWWRTKEDSKSDSDSESEDRSKVKRWKKWSKRDKDSDEESSAKLSKKRKCKSKHSDSSSEEEEEEDRKKKHKHKSKKCQDMSSTKESESSEVSNGTFVYCVIRQEHVMLGWSQAPCR